MIDHAFRGSIAALPTPFRDDALDLASLARLVDFHAENDTAGVLVAGSTGEASMLTEPEQRTIIELGIARGRGRLAVFAGCGTPATASTIALARFAAEVGADGIVCVTPYYVRPGQRGLRAHFGALADAVGLPIALYNNPARTGCDLWPATAAELQRAHPNIVAIKESSGSLARLGELRAATELAVLTGDDHLIAEAIALGAAGVIGVVANVAPSAVAELVRVARPGGDPQRTVELSARLAPLTHALALESNPGPVKAALAELGLGTAEVRSPLVPLAPENLERLRAALAGCERLADHASRAGARA